MWSQALRFMIRASVILFIVGASAQFSDWFSRAGDIAITPTGETWVAVDDDFMANCTLTASYAGPLNASFLYFDYPRNRPGTIEHVLDSRTRRLRIPAMKKTDSGLYMCHLNETSIGGPEYASGAYTSVLVNDPPQKVTNVSCVIDNFEWMTCTWCPQQKLDFLTDWTLRWRVGSVSGTWSLDLLGKCTCRFCLTTCADGQPNSFYRDMSYSMDITVRNDYGVARSVTTVRTSQHIVELRPVLHLEAVSHTSRSARLAWTYPEGFNPDWFDVVYEVRYDGRWEDAVKVEVVNDTLYMLTGLHPATLYSVSIRSRPAAGHLWSHPLTIHVQTDEEAPSVAPTIPPGSFRSSPCGGDNERCRDVTVFWQPIAEKYHNGPLLGYRVSFRGMLDKAPTVVLENISSLSTTLFQLDTRRDYLITVAVTNSAGLSPGATVSIATSNDLPGAPAGMVAEWNEARSHVALSWAAPPMTSVSNYTFFWCDRLVINQHMCKDPLHYQVVASNVTHILHAGRNDSRLGQLYALTANSDAGSSGMSEDWICVYDYDGLSEKPVFAFDGTVGARNVTLSWRPASCDADNRGRVLNHILELRKDGSEETLEEFTFRANVKSYTITNLRPYTNYTLLLAAVTRAGRSEFSEKRVTTLESRPDDAPASLKAIVGTDQVSLFWFAPPTPNGVILEYLVIARVGGIEVKRESVLTRRFTFDVDGGVAYNFTVVAVNRIGQSPEATPIFMTTPVRAPERIHSSQIRVDQLNATVATVQWSRPSPPNGPVDNYTIRCDLVDEADTKLTTWTERLPGNDTRANVSVKCNDTNVFMRVFVAAVNWRGTTRLHGMWSEARSVEMCNDPGGEVSATMIVLISAGVVTFLLVLLGAYFQWRCRRQMKKTLVILPPDRINSETGLMQPSRSSSTSTSDYNAIISPYNPATRDAIPSYTTCGTSYGSTATHNDIHDRNDGNDHSSVSNNFIRPEVEFQGSSGESEGSYAKATVNVLNGLLRTPDGPASSLVLPASTYEDLELKAVCGNLELNTVGLPEADSSSSAVDDLPPGQNLFKVYDVADDIDCKSAVRRTDNLCLPPPYDDNQTDATKIIAMPVDITVNPS